MPNEEPKAPDQEAGDLSVTQERRSRAGGRILRVWSNPAYRFVLLFLLYLGIASLGYPVFRERCNFVVRAMIDWTAQLEYYMFRLFTTTVSISDRLITFGGFPVKIIEECTGIYEVLIFGAAVVAFPTEWHKKAIGLGLGIPLLYAINLFRIAVLILVGRFHTASFQFMHLYFWQATLIVMITSVWLLWIFKVVRHEKEALPPHS